MKTIYKITIAVTVLLLPFVAKAHDARHDDVPYSTWHFNDHKNVVGYFLLIKNNELYLENTAHKIVHFPLLDLTESDRRKALNRYEQIGQINHSKLFSDVINANNTDRYLFFILLIIGLIFIYRILILHRASSIWTIGGYMLMCGFTNMVGPQSAEEIDKAFAPFKPHVNTFYDDTYFYVESNGIPTTHEMMLGIKAWQQQVPIPQCYLGKNAWPIPLNPVMAQNPIPVDMMHFTRGAVAIAANGIPIFNVHTNTGVDSYLDGQLDDFGGHCGRADDYHYHLPPLHLYQFTASSLPIAYALDGFPVYGEKEIDGSPVLPLDANHGHMDAEGKYHYHGSKEAPYMIARMAGQVTEDDTYQLIPQAAAKGVRPALTPLKGATIIRCRQHESKMGYSLIYSLNNNLDSVVYDWDQNGKYLYTFYKNGVPTVANYNGKPNCNWPITMTNDQVDHQSMHIYPNPSNGKMTIQWISTDHSAIQKMQLLNIKGQEVWSSRNFTSTIDVSNVDQGLYFLVITLTNNQVVKKIFIDQK